MANKEAPKSSAEMLSYAQEVHKEFEKLKLSSSRERISLYQMTENKNSYMKKNHDKLAAALRENLRKRKEQQKAKKKQQPEKEKKD